MRKAGERDLDGDRDLLFDFFRRMSRKQRDDVHLDVRDIRERLDRQVLECEHSTGDEQQHHQPKEHGLVEREGHHAADHRRRSVCGAINPGITTTFWLVGRAARRGARCP
jgi:hypothetical protein